MIASLVLNQETSVGDGSKPTYRDHLLQGDDVELQSALDAYAGSAKMDPAKKVRQLDGCRSDAWFVRHKTSGEVRIQSQTCKLRWCPFCAKGKTVHAAAEVTAWIKAQKYPKFLTLTVQHSDATLVDQVSDLYDEFKRFRKMKWFKDRCTGGIWFFQLTNNKNDGTWHPHLHCIVTGKYLPHRRLNREWEKVTGGSYITDVQMVNDSKNAANEVARYCARPARLSAFQPQEASEIVDAFHGRRLCGTWGTGRAMSFRQTHDMPKDEWQTLGSWYFVVNLADENDTAKEILNAYMRGETLPFYEPLFKSAEAIPIDENLPPPGGPACQQEFWNVSQFGTFTKASA